MLSGVRFHPPTLYSSMLAQRTPWYLGAGELSGEQDVAVQVVETLLKSDFTPVYAHQTILCCFLMIRDNGGGRSCPTCL